MTRNIVRIFAIKYDRLVEPSKPTQPANLQKKQCGGVYFWLNGIAYWMPIQLKFTSPVLLFSDFAGWEDKKSSSSSSIICWKLLKLPISKTKQRFWIS